MIYCHKLITTTQMNSVDQITFTPYDFNYFDNPENSTLRIIMWSLNTKSERVAITLDGFPLMCHIQLPVYVKLRPMVWSTEKIQLIQEAFRKRFREDAPTRCEFVRKPKIYYYRGDRKEPMLMVSFKSMEALAKFSKVLRKDDFEVDGIGKLRLQVWEDKISPILKLLSNFELGFAQWMKVIGKKVDAMEAITSCENEYRCQWRTLKQVEQEEVKTFNIHPSIVAFDLETYSHRPKCFPEPFFIEDAIFMVSVIYQRIGIPESRQRYAILYGDCDESKLVESHIIKVDNELSLLEKFRELIVALDPIVITGYNIYGFDYRYMEARFTKFFMNTSEGWGEMGKLNGYNSKIKEIAWASSAYGHQMMSILDAPGRISIDLFPIVKREYKLSKYDLDTVSNYFLGRGKHDVKAQQMFECFEAYLNNREDALEKMTSVMAYCIQDSELVVDLFEKLNIWVSMSELANVVSIPMIDLFTRGQQLRCASQVYRLASKQNYVLTTCEPTDVVYTGGSVHEPIPGLYENVICLDFASLYPSIMRAYNICYTTFVPDDMADQIKDEDCNVMEFEQIEPLTIRKSFKKGGEDDDADALEIDIDAETYDDFDDDGELDDEGKPKRKLAPNTKIVKYRYRFVKKEIRRGLLPTLVENLVNERNALRKHLDGNEAEGIPKEKNPTIRNIINSRQLALKVSANSFYGFLGVHNGKMPLMQGAMSITARGRELIKMVGKFVETQYNGRIVYGDTDSCMAMIPAITDSTQCNEWGNRLSTEISELFPSPLKMEFEKAMRLLCIKKKKYAAALINKKGEHQLDDAKLLKKGIVLARRDNCAYLRKVYTGLLSIIMNKGKIVDGFNLLADSAQAILDGSIDPKLLTIIKSVNANYASPTYPMRVFVDRLKEQGKPVQPGDRLEYIIVEAENGDPKAKMGMKMCLIEDYDPKRHKIDILYYLDKALKNPIDQLFSIGYSRQLQSLSTFGVEYKVSVNRNNFISINSPMAMIATLIQRYNCEDITGLKDNFKEELESIGMLDA
jgi:DNA polymerase elongation subunit (family B)